MDDQLQDIRRFCCNSHLAETSILGVDKTFNLGQLHVTVTVFKNLAMLRRSTGQHPIFLGPMYIHGSSTNVDYSFFFDHLRSVLDAPSPTLVGSDDEKAIKSRLPSLAKWQTTLLSQTFVPELCRPPTTKNQNE